MSSLQTSNVLALNDFTIFMYPSGQMHILKLLFKCYLNVIFGLLKQTYAATKMILWLYKI